MKSGKRMLCMLLALVCILSLVPMTALAAHNTGCTFEGVACSHDPATNTACDGNPDGTCSHADGCGYVAPGVCTCTGTITVITKFYSDSKMTKVAGTGAVGITIGQSPVTLDGKSVGMFVTSGKTMYEFAGYSTGSGLLSTVGVKPYNTDDPAGWAAEYANLVACYVPHKHSYYTKYDRVRHWAACRCGSAINFAYHVDPAKDDDKVCTCGYKFSDNADLSTLWFTNVRFDNRFHRDTTDYSAYVPDWVRTNISKVTARPMDAMATVDAPKTIKLENGLQKIEITVTAEDKSTTKTYTVLINTPIKVDKISISSTIGSRSVTTATLKTYIPKGVAISTMTKAAGEALLQQMEEVGTEDACLNTAFNKWNAKRAEITIAGEFIKLLAEKADADLILTTSHCEVIIPHDTVTKLPTDHDVIVTVEKDGTISATSNGEDISDLL